jgi:acetamidase/formamidase
VRRGAVLDDAVLLPEGLRMEVLGVSVLHPGDVVEVAKAGVVPRGWGAIVVARAVGSLNALLRVRCRRFLHADVAREETLQDATGLAHL